MDAAVISAIVSGGLALLTAIILKVYDSVSNKPSRKDSTPAEMRAELREQIESLRKDIETLKAERDLTEKEMLEWREKYWKLVEEHNRVTRQMLDYLSELHRVRSLLDERNGSGQ